MRILRVAFCLVLPVAGYAQPVSEYGRVGNWTVKIDPENGNGCFMERTYDSGTLVQIGVVPDREGAFFAAYNAAWRPNSASEVSTVLFDFGDSRFQGEVVAAVHDDLPGGYAFFDNPEFANEFAKRTTVRVEGASGKTEDLDLSGSHNGLEAVRKCQVEQNAE